MFDGMKRHLPFLIATLLCFPFSAFAMLYLVAVLGGFNDLPDSLQSVLYVGFIVLASWPVVTLPVLAVASVSVVAAWLQKTKAGFEVVLISIYSFIMVLHLTFTVWCLVTKPVFNL